MKPISIEEGNWGDPGCPYRWKITFDAICPENQFRFVKTEEEAHTLFAMMRLGFHEDQINEMLRPEPMGNNSSGYGVNPFWFFGPEPGEEWKE